MPVRPTSVGRSLLVMLMCLAGLSMLPGSTSSASCAAPSLALAGSDQPRPAVRRGAEVTVTGRDFIDGCDDTGGGSVFGCAEEDAEVEEPMTDLDLVLRHGRPRQVVVLATADADSSGAVTWTFVVPLDAAPGPAVLRADTAQPLPVRIR